MGVQGQTQMDRKRPIYVTLEGIDSSGKTTLAASLSKKLPALGISVTCRAEFPRSDEFEAALLHEALSKSIFISESFRYGPQSAFFYMAFVDSLTWPERTLSELIIGDRGPDSLCVYQGYFASGKEA